MKREDRIILRFSIAVSIRCNTDDNPLPENPTPEQAADYIQKVLEILFAKTGKQIYVYPLKHPVSSKFPLVIQLGDISECLFWLWNPVGWRSTWRSLFRISSAARSPFPPEVT